MFNTHLVINSDGKIVGRYDKTHLFDVEIPERNIKLKESDYIVKGGSITPPIESPIGKIGLGIVSTPALVYVLNDSSNKFSRN